jgi:N-acetylmuramoyl-L-alanine amidase
MDVALILKDLRLDANLLESKRLACAVQGELVAATVPDRKAALAIRGSPRNRGVKQALFHVLLGADMPSILVEAGFLTHPRDRAIVLSEEGQRSIATAMADALDRYRALQVPRGPRSEALARLSSCKIN